jgi:uncharacterized protein YceH (UPF0502 family)
MSGLIFKRNLSHFLFSCRVRRYNGNHEASEFGQRREHQAEVAQQHTHSLRLQQTYADCRLLANDEVVDVSVFSDVVIASIE